MKEKIDRSKWVYPDDKPGKGFKLNEYENIRMKIDVPNAETMKTVQVDLNGWITIDWDYDLHQIEKELLYVKFGVKQQIRNWKQKYFRKESIIVLDTRLIPTATAWQFFSLEITHFVNPGMVYDKQTLMNLLQPFYENLIDEVLIKNNRIFKITRSTIMDNRKNVSKENKLRKLESNL